MVDTGNAESSDKVFAAVRQITDKPIRWIINTHAHLDNVGGNEGVIKLAGGQRTSQGGGGGGVENPNGPLVVAHLDAVNMMMDAKPEYPDEAIPKDSFFSDNKQIYFNGEGIEVWEVPHAHSAGDLIVFFRKSDVIAVGDLVSPNTYPVFDVEAGGTLQGVLDAMNRIVPMMIPRFNQMDGTRVLPSHGRISDQSDVAEFRDMATIVRDRIQYMIDKGMSLEQVKAARPTLDYDPVLRRKQRGVVDGEVHRGRVHGAEEQQGAEACARPQFRRWWQMTVRSSSNRVLRVAHGGCRRDRARRDRRPHD